MIVHRERDAINPNPCAKLRWRGKIKPQITTPHRCVSNLENILAPLWSNTRGRRAPHLTSLRDPFIKLNIRIAYWLITARLTSIAYTIQFFFSE